MLREDDPVFVIKMENEHVSLRSLFETLGIGLEVLRGEEPNLCIGPNIFSPQ